ncbi:sarcosine oxidase subunit gamma [Sulfitobacter sp. JB4-11]|uniref:sarcosine oxidase subunit gamma n=1 Tax=Sulfitobacter rhodophyticola TaxID=3238304 RepID=UPI0035125F48
MVDLNETSACAGLLPLSIGRFTVEEHLPGALTSISPFDAAAMAKALEKGHGLAWPAPNRSSGKAQARCIWFGHREVLLMGPLPDATLTKHGAVVDVTDGWAVVHLQGAGVEDVLARLVPVDLSPAAFKRGHTARTMLVHMNASITRIGADAFEILVFRSMATTLVHDLKRAMESVTARG